MRVSISVTIGAICAIVVLVVAASTLAITYSVAVTTVREVGVSHAGALAHAATLETAAFFGLPTQLLNGLAALYRQPEFGIPVESTFDQTMTEAAQDRYFAVLFSLLSGAKFAYKACGMIFDDGSGVIISPLYTSPLTDQPTLQPDVKVQFTSRLANATTNGAMTDMLFRYSVVNVATGKPVAVSAANMPPRNVDSRFAAYESAKMLLSGTSQGIWYNPTVYIQSGAVQFDLPCVVPLLDRLEASGRRFLGFGLMTVPLGDIDRFLANVGGTTNTMSFAVDGQGYLIGSTHPTPFVTVTNHTKNPVVLPGCASSADTAAEGNTVQAFIYLGCRAQAKDFSAYPPLQAYASDDALSKSTKPVVKIVDDIGGNRDTFFIAASPVPNTFRAWGVRIVLCMPEEDILGRMIAGRNIAIAVSVVIFVVASVISFFIVVILLRPLTQLSRRMTDTANLKSRPYRRPKNDEEFSLVQPPTGTDGKVDDAADDANDDTPSSEDLSSFAEIRALQKAYNNMNNAIQSFTRYVPRDVVKDLMASGQLCRIQMSPLRCTIVFADIVSFTTVCERVDPTQLSKIVTTYFDRASRIIMAHDGLIDKFIGDCVMAVWGAPFAVTNHELKATLAGLLIHRETHVEPLVSMWGDVGEELKVRVGVNTGDVLAGNMGSPERMNYTVIGDPVNLASRVEGLNRQFDTSVMVTEYTAEALENVFVLRLLLPIAVVGKTRPVKVYEVLGVNPDANLNLIAEPSHVSRRRSSSNLGSARATPHSAPLAPAGGDLAAGDDLFSNSQMIDPSIQDTPLSRSLAYVTLRRSRQSTASLFRHAVTVSKGNLSILCAKQDVEYAATHTRAVEAYCQKQFTEAKGLLERSHHMHSTPTACGAAGLSNSSFVPSPATSSTTTPPHHATGQRHPSQQPNAQMDGFLMPPAFDLDSSVRQQQPQQRGGLKPDDHRHHHVITITDISAEEMLPAAMDGRAAPMGGVDEAEDPIVCFRPSSPSTSPAQRSRNGTDVIQVSPAQAGASSISTLSAGRRTDTYGPNSSQLLMRLCEEALQNGVEPGFNGVYKASQK